MAVPPATKLGHGLAKVLGIKLNNPNQAITEELTRGESAYSIDTAETFVEDEPTSAEWLNGVIPPPKFALTYLRSLFPFTNWITRYNAQWLYGDLVAGITVGAVVVPQSMAYAKLANLAPQFGLYSSFMGVLIYWFFATSKDITIGPVAVMSTIVGNIVTKVHKKDPKIAANVVASALAVICGAIIAFIGLVRCGWIVDLISLTAIAAFMTGSALNIAMGQIPALMGITGFSNRDATYKVFIHTLQHLGRTKLDAALGLTALFLLYAIRSACNYAGKKNPQRRKTFFFVSTLRTAFVILLYTLISWLMNRHHRKKPRISILGTVPRGFKNAKVPTITKQIIKDFASELPASVIVLLIEHIAISKSFGRVNNYVINPSQEMVAIGVTNLLGPFLGAYPATGSFSRTAIKSKAGVRTPFAGVITAVVVLLAIYALPAVFFYIPNALLSAVIIHAVGDLITPPSTVYQFWKVSPFEVIIFFTGVIVTVFTSIENGIYTTISVSFAVFLFRTIKAKGSFLGRVQVHSVLGDHVVGNDGKIGDSAGSGKTKEAATRNLFLPIDHHDGSNPQVEVDSPYPGIFIYRFSEGFNYPNANHYLDYLTAYIFSHTRRTNAFSYPRLGDRPWNDPGPRRGQPAVVDDHLPTLKAIILDFSSVNNVDITSIQQLIDVRNQLDRYASPDKVDWHFASINNRWTKRALISAGFGYPAPDVPAEGVQHRWKPIFSVAEIGGWESAANTAELQDNEKQQRTLDLETGKTTTAVDHIQQGSGNSSATDFGKDISKTKAYGKSRLAVVHGLNRPLIHIDLTSALQSAVANVEARVAAQPKETAVPASAELS